MRTQSLGPAFYDAFGNIQSITGSPGRATPTDSATNRLQGTAEFSQAGNLASWNGNVYEYDSFHMMTRMIAGAEDYLYVYTADDERIWQFRMGGSSPGHSYTLRDLGGQVLREYSATGDFWTIERDYVYGGRQLLAAETPEGQRHFHLDHLGTPRLITVSNGGRVAYHVYFPFGEEATEPFQDQERMKFTGHERDLADPDGTGDDLDYMHARFCSPLTGRFTSMDPAAASFSPGAPQTWNRYTYVLNNPLNAVDPDGQFADIIEEVSGTQWAALIGDAVGAALPLATGVGAAVRAAAKPGTATVNRHGRQHFSVEVSDGTTSLQTHQVTSVDGSTTRIRQASGSSPGPATEFRTVALPNADSVAITLFLSRSFAQKYGITWDKHPLPDTYPQWMELLKGVCQRCLEQAVRASEHDGTG